MFKLLCLGVCGSLGRLSFGEEKKPPKALLVHVGEYFDVILNYLVE